MSDFTIAPVTDEVRVRITLLTHIHGLALEINTGMKLSNRGPALSTTVKRTWGIRGTKQALLGQLCALMEEIDDNFEISGSIRKALEK